MICDKMRSRDLLSGTSLSLQMRCVMVQVNNDFLAYLNLICRRAKLNMLGDDAWCDLANCAALLLLSVDCSGIAIRWLIVETSTTISTAFQELCGRIHPKKEDFADYAEEWSKFSLNLWAKLSLLESSSAVYFRRTHKAATVNDATMNDAVSSKMSCWSSLNL